MTRLSIIIPDYKDSLLHKTIDSLLDNSQLGDQLEVIAVLDGCWSATPFREDNRINVVHLGKNRGMRGAINAGIDVAKGEFIMRTDEHCMFASGYDKILTDTCQPNWIVTATRYFLDPTTWERMDLPPVNFEKLVIQNGVKFSGSRWESRDKEKENVMIDETMAMQGSMWLMSRKWWDKVIGELQTEGYSPSYQDSHEMIFKTWKAGGKMMLNKNTWYAHKHRGFSRTHQEGTKDNPSNREGSWKYALDMWREYYEEEIVPLWKLNVSTTNNS